MNRTLAIYLLCTTCKTRESPTPPDARSYVSTGLPASEPLSPPDSATTRPPIVTDKAPIPSRAPGCSLQSEPAGTHVGQLEVRGKPRSFRYHVPKAYNSRREAALLLGFHGRNGNSEMGDSWGLHSAASLGDFVAITIFAQGLVQPSGPVGWNLAESGEDFAFFDSLVDWAQHHFCIDRHKIAVAGFSWGCDFANALGCHRSEQIRAIQCFSGAFFSVHCGSPTPAFRITYSSPDGTDAYSQAEFDRAIAHYRNALGCSGETRSTSHGACVAWMGCQSPVEACAYPGVGHTAMVNSSPGVDTWAFFRSTF